MAFRGTTLESRSYTISQANSYINNLAITPEAKPIPPALNQVVSELRKTAGSIRVNAQTRLRAVEKLLFLEGINVRRDQDSTWALFDKILGITSEKEETLTAKTIRQGARNAALRDVRDCYLKDLRDGRFRGKSAEEVAEHFRLPEIEPVLLDDEDIGDKLLKEFQEKYGSQKSNTSTQTASVGDNGIQQHRNTTDEEPR